MPFTHIDCFSGPGGLCTGFRAAGIRTVLAIEKVESCIETYTANHPHVPVIHKDIRFVTEEEIKAIVPGEVDILTSGMPCETFSTAGSKSRSSYDHRQYLFMEAIRIAKVVNAKIILFENVPGITTKKAEKDGSRLIIDDLYDALAEHGYQHHVSAILNSADFGVPQFRERFFVIASREDLNLKVPVSHHRDLISVAEAISDLPRVEANSKQESTHYLNTESKYSKLMKDNDFWKLDKPSKGLTYHIPPNHRPGTLKRFALIEQGEGLKDLFEKFSKDEISTLQVEKVLPKKWYIQRNRRLRETTPSVTVTSHCLDELLHPWDNRSLTVREVARLQSFPDAYDFKGGPLICPHLYETQDKYEQIGDAVPPLLAYHWGLTIQEIFKENARDSHASRNKLRGFLQPAIQ